MVCEPSVFPVRESAAVRKSKFADAVQVSLARGSVRRHGRHFACAPSSDSLAEVAS
jgi:hypothetical protein